MSFVIVQVIVGGLLLGAVYALFSSGLTLVWGMMNVVNFAHGDFVMLGMYVAFAHWDIDGRKSLPKGRTSDATKREEETGRDDVFTPVYAANDDSAPREVAVPQRVAAPQVAARVLSASSSLQATAALKSEPERFEDESEPEVATPAEAPLAARKPLNDNRVSVAHGVPDSDVQRFYRERVTGQEGSSVTAQDLYEDYCVWCEEQDKEPFAAPRVSREIKELGVRKERIGGRIRYIGISLRSSQEKKGDPRRPASITRAA